MSIDLNRGDGAHVDPDHEREQVAGQEAGGCRGKDERMSDYLNQMRNYFFVFQIRYMHFCHKLMTRAQFINLPVT